MYNRKLNPSNFRLLELSVDNLVLDKDQFFTYRVIGIDLIQEKVMIERAHGEEIIKKIVPFTEIAPLPLWNHQNMLDPIVCDWLFLNRLDDWEADFNFYDHEKKLMTVKLVNKFPVDHYALFAAPNYPAGPIVLPVWYAHEVQNLLNLFASVYPNQN